MRATSLRDIMLADSLSGFKNEVSVIHPDNDGVVQSILQQIGYDVNSEWWYEASKHRNLRGQIAIGYMIVGEYSKDPKYRHFLDTTDRIIVAGMCDPSLGRDMSALMGRKNIYRNDDDKWNDGSRAKKDDPRYYSEAELLEYGYTSGNEEDEDECGVDYIEETWEQDLRAIKVLEELRDEIRKGI